MRPGTALAAPTHMAIASNCNYTQIGVWSDNGLDRAVAGAVAGQPARPSDGTENENRC